MSDGEVSITEVDIAFEVRGIPVEVVRKDIENVHLAVYPPTGHVRVAVPEHVDDTAARLAVIERLGWIRRHRADLQAQQRQSEREMVTGESHYVWGRRYRLNVIRHTGPNRVHVNGPNWLGLYVRSDATTERRRHVLREWYRDEVRGRMPDLVETWAPKVGVTVRDWDVRVMKTKWGSCSPEAGRIRVNLELAKKPPQCLTYIAVHEMVHLEERRHNDRFRTHLDRVMPNWRVHRDVLNAEPLAHQDWKY